MALLAHRRQTERDEVRGGGAGGFEMLRFWKEKKKRNLYGGKLKNTSLALFGFGGRQQISAPQSRNGQTRSDDTSLLDQAVNLKWVIHDTRRRHTARPFCAIPASQLNPQHVRSVTGRLSRVCSPRSHGHRWFRFIRAPQNEYLISASAALHYKHFTVCLKVLTLSFR